MRTNIETMKTKYMVNRQQITECTGITRMDYNVLVHDTALAWVRNQFCNDEDVVNKMTKNPKFWKWWNNHWDIRNEAFFSEYVWYVIDKKDFKEYLLNEWLKYHSLKCINVFPSSELLSQLFAEVVGETIHEVQADMQDARKNNTNRKINLIP